MKRKTGLIIFSIVVVGAIVGLILTYASKVSLLYLKTDEVFARLNTPMTDIKNGPKSILGKKFRIHGKLLPRSTKRQKGRLDWYFRIVGKSGRSLPVRYNGILPDTFRDNAELVIEGKLERSNLFVAYSVFAKCPSKYEGQTSPHKKKGKTSKPTS